MNKFIVIVCVYDGENTQAYPLGGIFQTQKAAKEYITGNVIGIKSKHWCKDCINGEGFYVEEYLSDGSFLAKDMSNGQSLELEIHEVPEMDL